VRLPLVALALATLVTGSGLGLASPAHADRVQTYSLSKLHCADCGADIGRSVKKVKGIRKYAFDYHKVEMTVTMADAVTDDQVLAAVRAAGFDGSPGAGHGQYLAFPPYPDSVDAVELTGDGSAVGRFDSLRVAGKYTVFDVYAPWCMPCRAMDDALRQAVGTRADVAVRRLNVVSFESPLARQLGSHLKALPYVVVYAPDGKRTEVAGLNTKKVQAALAVR
jgi:copper chaperone CopZ